MLRRFAIRRRVAFAGVIPVLSVAAMDTLHRDLGVPTVDPTRGVLMLRALDCEGKPAAGVQIQLQPMSGDVDELAVPYNLAPSNLAVDGFVTDGRGVAGFINLSPQSFTLAATAPGGEEFARTVVSVRPNVITLAELRLGLGVWGQ